MSSIIRKIERDIVKKNIEKKGLSKKKAFKNNWDEYRDKKYIIRDKDENVILDNTPKNTMKKKQKHFDNKEQYFNLFSFVNNLANKKEEKKYKEQ